jgi:putative transposase
MPLYGPDGLVDQLIRAVIERALGAELDDHLGYLKDDMMRDPSAQRTLGA